MANEKKQKDGSTILIYHPFYLEHANPQGHPEQSERLSVTYQLLKESRLLSNLKLISPFEAAEEIICMVHDSQYVNSVKEVAELGGGYIDADTIISPSSFKAAALAVGGVLSAVDNLCSGENLRAFCLLRPPGHHATAQVGMGFCIFNNLAVGAKYAFDKYKISRILIIDWDAHHGNGIQDIFYDSPHVLYVSLHQYPLYPGTGEIAEVGQGKGEGYTVNIPLPAGSGDEIYLEVFLRIIAPVAFQFKPELIMVAAGYDGHFADPLASLKLTTSGYARMTKEVLSLASSSGGKVIFSLEGGYNLEALSYSILVTLSELAGIEREVSDPFGAPKNVLQIADGRKNLDLVIENLSSYWDL